jgi:hypothetical protein
MDARFVESCCAPHEVHCSISPCIRTGRKSYDMDFVCGHDWCDRRLGRQFTRLAWRCPWDSRYCNRVVYIIVSYSALTARVDEHQQPVSDRLANVGRTSGAGSNVGLLYVGLDVSCQINANCVRTLGSAGVAEVRIRDSIHWTDSVCDFHRAIRRLC